jgi:hypothetical protein
MNIESPITSLFGHGLFTLTGIITTILVHNGQCNKTVTYTDKRQKTLCGVGVYFDIDSISNIMASIANSTQSWMMARVRKRSPTNGDNGVYEREGIGCAQSSDKWMLWALLCVRTLVFVTRFRIGPVNLVTRLAYVTLSLSNMVYVIAVIQGRIKTDENEKESILLLWSTIPDVIISLWWWQHPVDPPSRNMFES